MNRIVPLLALVVGVFSASGCGMSIDRAAEPSHSVFTDPDVERWKLGDSPRLEIGGADEREGYALGGLRGAVLLRDRLVIADRQFSEVRFYSLSGELLARSGREGSGPGEYRAVVALARYDDSTVVAWDVSLRRLTLLGADGDVRRTISPDLSSVTNIEPRFKGVLDGGRFVFRDERSVMSLRGEPTGERRDSIGYVILQPDGSWAGLGWREPGEEVFYRDANRVRGTAPVIFGRSTLETIAGASMVIGSNDSLRLERIAGDGSIRDAARFPWVPTPATSEWVEAERQRLLDEAYDRIERTSRRGFMLSPASEARVTAAAEERHRLLPNRRTLPAFSDLRSDALGNIWVAEYAAPGSSVRTWAVLDSLLEPVATIDVPSHIEILDLGAEDLVGATTDELERATVALYPIIR